MSDTEQPPTCNRCEKESGVAAEWGICGGCFADDMKDAVDTDRRRLNNG